MFRPRLIAQTYVNINIVRFIFVAPRIVLLDFVEDWLAVHYVFDAIRDAGITTLDFRNFGLRTSFFAKREFNFKNTVVLVTSQ